MKAGKVPPILLMMLVCAAVVSAQPRYKDRSSTDPQGDMERVSVRGKIESIEGQKALVRMDDGQKVTVHLGPQHYWREKGYHLRAGVDATIDGWGEMYGEDGGFIYAGSIYGDGFYFELCDSEGYPRWADRDEYWDGWHPRRDYYVGFYFGPPPWRGWGPPPHHHWRPHHRPWRHDRYDGPPPPPPPRHERGGRHHWR